MLSAQPTELFQLILFLTPATFLALAVYLRGNPHRWSQGVAFIPAAFALAGTVILAGSSATHTSPGHLIYADALSFTLLLLVSTIGGAVLVYSRQYLQGDPRHSTFMCQLSLIFAAVSTLVIAGNLYLVMLSWVAMSLCLHQLLNFRSERPGARIAANKKYMLARLGDLSLVLAFGILIDTLGTANLSEIITTLKTVGEGTTLATDEKVSLGIAAALIALTAVLKSAQFPAHGWLVEVMETPTPVSAVLHAGVVNAGGFLFLRFSDLMMLSPNVSLTVAALGICTAIIGSAIMLAQPSIKASLAYSTVAQMGFMMAQCGLGAYAAAVVHLVGHSLYKAHAFLNSGNAVAELRKHQSTSTLQSGSIAGYLLLTAMLGLYAAVCVQSNVTWQQMPVEIALGAVFVMGVWLLTDAGNKSLLANVWLLAGVALSSALYFVVQKTARTIFETTLAEASAADAATQFLLAALMLGSLLLVIIQRSPEALGNSRLMRLRHHLAQGLYVNSVVNRRLGEYSITKSNAA